MKNAFLTLLTLLFIACNTKKAITYAEGLEQCNKLQKEKKKANPNGFFLAGPDCLIGAQIPAFEATSMEGEKISHTSLKGKVSILNFWFTTCAPCVAEIPGFNAIVEKYGKDQINYLAIGRDRKSDVQEFLREHPWDFKQVTDGNDIMMNDFKLSWGYPTTLLLDKDAKIVLAFSGGKPDSTAVQEIQDKLIPIIEKELKR